MLICNGHLPYSAMAFAVIQQWAFAVNLQSVFVKTRLQSESVLKFRHKFTAFLLHYQII